MLLFIFNQNFQATHNTSRLAEKAQPRLVYLFIKNKNHSKQSKNATFPRPANKKPSLLTHRGFSYYLKV